MKYLENIEVLHLDKNNNITDEGLKYLKKHKNICYER
ncbi:hypothetical protein Catovirus_1_649 [Catovirus CTV1]|uniref:Leucine-rich repeat protein n=1 Tax=Catovirus CTV1 TaxID=1977631 RepID=A0A1V0SA78_9VIRU|nr:hypothetical protein Catovirus_1_649 [Catovirus CTV1]